MRFCVLCVALFVLVSCFNDHILPCVEPQDTCHVNQESGTVLYGVFSRPA